MASFVSSYIPTTTSAVTRAASLGDIVNAAIANNIRSFYAEFSNPALGVCGVASLNDNTSNERVEILSDGADPFLIVYDGASEQTNVDGGTIAANATTKVAVRISANNFAICVDGGSVEKDTSGTLPTIDRLMIGRTQAGQYLNGRIARLTGWSESLSDSALQVLTQ